MRFGIFSPVFHFKCLPGFPMYLPEREWNTSSWFPSSYLKGLGEATSAVLFAEKVKLCELASILLVATSLSPVQKDFKATYSENPLI